MQEGSHMRNLLYNLSEQTEPFKQTLYYRNEKEVY